MARVYVKVVGFSDVERHALNTVFRLSELRPTSYALWAPDAPEAPLLCLIDGASYEAPVEMASPSTDVTLKLIWVGDDAPDRAWRVFDRPLAWARVVAAMDEVFAPPAALDFNLDDDPAGPDTEPPDPVPNGKRALIVAASREDRLYMRARLALAELTQADEATTAAEAHEFLRGGGYAVALVDFGLPDADGWAFMKDVAGGRSAVPHVIVTKPRASAGERLRARLAGAALLDKPPDPGRLQRLLQKV
jgi:CheY-like chemotaxis protein